MKTIFSFLFSLFSLSVIGQRLFPIQIEKDSFVFSLKVKGQGLVLEQVGASNLFQTKKDFPVIEKVTLEEADIVLHYQSTGGGGFLSDSIALTLKLPNGEEITAKRNELSDAPDQHSGRNLAWLDATEQLTAFGSTYTLYVTRSLMGAVNCDAQRPTMSPQLRLLSYAGGAVGLVFCYVGSIYKDEKKAAYNRYKQLWKDGAVLQKNAESPLDEAIKDDRNAKIFTWTGVGIIAANAIIFNVKWYKIGQKQKYYDKFCGNKNKTSFNIEPSKTGVGIVLNF